jgi:hypothetical protein
MLLYTSPLRAHWRPLTLYLGIEGLHALKHVMMTAMGFRRHVVDGGAAYYTFNMFYDDNRASPASDKPQTPILFAHGVGIGILPYVHMLARMAASGHPIIAFEFNHLAMRVSAAAAKHHVPALMLALFPVVSPITASMFSPYTLICCVLAVDRLCASCGRSRGLHARSPGGTPHPTRLCSGALVWHLLLVGLDVKLTSGVSQCLVCLTATSCKHQ